MIKKLFEYYLAHQDELVEKYSGKYLVIAFEFLVQVMFGISFSTSYSCCSTENGTNRLDF